MRSLPTKRNPLIVDDKSTDYDELLQRRRLGRTRLVVKPGQVGTSNATKAENLGPVEYAHLRAPLPEDLAGSGIFPQPGTTPHPETYFLMRRSKDGYVSATGMFKIAFPWAQQEEEKAERDFLKSLDSTSQDEIAGNVWISPQYALELAEAYGLTMWIRALLDPTDIIQSPTSAKKQIAAPPKFDLPLDNHVKLVPLHKESRARSMRSMSPAKSTGTPGRPIKSPRKRQTKAQKEANLAHANAASASLQSALDEVTSVTGGDESSTPAPESATDGPQLIPSSAIGETVRVEVDQAVEVNGDTEVTHTNVTVSMPAGLPELPLPQDTESMLEKAKQMVEEAKALEASADGALASSPKISRKRKVEEVEPSDIDSELPTQPAKKAKVLEEKLKREKVRNRAMIGVTAMLSIAAAIPYFFA